MILVNAFLGCLFNHIASLGYPIMVKAVAGGGGKGIRVVRNESELLDALNLTRQEAKASFDDNRILIERYIDNPKHIEVQILCDKHGNALHLYERDCSIQRRNQKVIEEAPSLLLTSSPSLRRQICDQAIALARAVGYDSAGTVEFLFDVQNQSFYFLEVNARLQVEHPVTECITGVDIVHQMLRIAKGHPLLYRQEDIPLQGWAMESRLCAEDPFKSFGSPSVGQLISYKEPNNFSGVRCDSGVVEGSHISLFYDSLICKLLTYSSDRKTVLELMRKALDNFVISGVKTNIPLLWSIVNDPTFISGECTINHLAKAYPNGFTGVRLSEEDVFQLIAVATAIHVKAAIRNYIDSR